MSRSILRKLGIGVAAVGFTGVLIAGCGNRHWGHWGHHGHHFSDPEKAKEHAEEAAEWVMDRVDASDEQQAKVKTIVGAAVGDFTDLANQHRAQRDAFMAAFAQETIDRGELEKFAASKWNWQKPLPRAWCKPWRT